MEKQGRLRIQRVSRRFRILFVVLIFCAPILDLLYWMLFNYLPEGLLVGLPTLPQGSLSSWSLFLGFTVSLIPLTVALYAMAILAKLFGLYEQAVIFSRDNVLLFRRLGYALIAWVVASMLFTTLISMVLSFGNPPGQRLVVAEFSVSEFTMLIMAFIVLLISWVMDEGRKLQDEQRYTI